MESLVRFESFFGSVKGIAREQNQDNYLIIDEPHYKLFFLFDGVGGAQNGKKATELATDFIKSNSSKFLLDGDYDIKRLVIATNQAILNSGLTDALTTVCCLVILTDETRKIYISNIGDTRVYSFNFQSLKQLTIDDNLPGMNNVITKCLGMEGLNLADVHVYVPETRPQNFLLCTDGLYNLFEGEKLNFLKALNSKNKKNKIENMIEGRNTDDASFIVVYQ